MSTLTSRGHNSHRLPEGQRTDKRAPRPEGTFSPDSGWAWVVAFASMVNAFLLVSFYRSLSILVVELMEIYEAPTAKASLIFTCISIGFAVTSVLFIFGVGDIFHERALIAASCVLVFSGFLGTFFSTRIEHVCLQGFCAGAATQVGMTCAMSLVGRYFHKRLSVANGLVMSGRSLGALLSPPILQWLLDEYTYRGTALICAGLTLNSLVCCSLMRPVPRTVTSEMVPIKDDDDSHILEKSEESNPTDNITANVSNAPSQCHSPKNTAVKNYSNVTTDTEMENFVASPDVEIPNTSRKANTTENFQYAKCFKVLTLAVRNFSLKDKTDRPPNASVWTTILPSISVLKNPVLPFFQLFIFFASVGSECVVQFYPASTRELGMSEYQSAFLLSMAGVGDLLSRVGLGLLGDYNIIARYKLVTIPQFVLGTACFLSRFATKFWSQGIFAVVIGLTYGTSTAYKALVLIDFFGLQELNRLLGISNLVCSLGLACGSPLIGYLRDLTGDFEVPLQTIGAILFAAGLSMLLAGACNGRHRPKRDQHDCK